MASILLTNFAARKDNLVKLSVSSYSILWMHFPEIYPSQRGIARLHVTPKMRVFFWDLLMLRGLLGRLGLLLIWLLRIVVVRAIIHAIVEGVHGKGGDVQTFGENLNRTVIKENGQINVKQIISMTRMVIYLNNISNSSAVCPITPNASWSVRPRNSSSIVTPFMVSAYAKKSNCRDTLTSLDLTISSLRMAST